MVTTYHVLVDILVPLILLFMFLTGIYITRRVSERLPALAGLAAGFVAFAIYAVSSFSKFRAVPFNASTLPSFQWLPTVVGVLLGFLILWLVQRLGLSSGLVGLFVLLLVASSSIAAFSYFFISPLRRYAIYFTLGMLFGVLAYLAVFSEKLREIPELRDVLPGRRR